VHLFQLIEREIEGRRNEWPYNRIGNK